jgi:hypothetical protein
MRIPIFILLLLFGNAVHAFVTTISGGGGQNRLYLQVGVGQITGGTNFSAGGTPGNNGTINQVTLDVGAAQLGNGPLTMTTNSTFVNSYFDGFAFCNAPNQVYVGGFLRRRTGNTNSGTLSVTVPSTLTNGTGDTINFNSISYTPSGNGDTSFIIPAGTLTPGTTNLYTYAANQWAEVCLTFAYANNTIVASGTYTGRITYTLTAP